MSTLIARQTFFAEGRKVSRGEGVDSDDSIVAGRAGLFELAAPAPTVEQATAAPGETRNVRKRSAAKK